MKGKTNNPNGRPKGVPNKMSRDIKDFIKEVIEKNMSQILKDIKTLEPKERLSILEKFMQYVIPKQKSVDFNGEIQAKPIPNDREQLLLESIPEDTIADIAEMLQDAMDKQRNSLMPKDF